MPHPLFITFPPYVWPYPPGPIFLVLTVAALAIGMILAHRAPRLRRLLPLLGVLILAVAVPMGFLIIPPQNGVLFGELYTTIAVALPGGAILLGSALGRFFYWFITRE